MPRKNHTAEEKANGIVGISKPIRIIPGQTQTLNEKPISKEDGFGR
jgi:hypothetical protein